MAVLAFMAASRSATTERSFCMSPWISRVLSGGGDALAPEAEGAAGRLSAVRRILISATSLL